MASRLVHRGPDEGGVWSDSQGRVALGHRRLSILDLSPAGSQPMSSACGRFTLVYNGEVYNHAAMRKGLTAAGVALRGRSDTEVLLETIVRLGLAQTVQLANGLFAFAVWDNRERTLSLVRDRLGIKPLYYAWIGCQFVFGSELKAFLAHPQFHAEIDRQSLGLLLQHSYIPTPRTIYRDVWKLPPGCVLTVREGPAAGEAPQAYWSLDWNGRSSAAARRRFQETPKAHPPNWRSSSMTRWRSSGWRTCPSARFSRAGSTPRRWLR
jgi:asparagine synthase (glutamine-hydrolysing)